MTSITVFKQKKIKNAASITLNKSQLIANSYENEGRIQEIQKGIKYINACNIIDVDSNEDDVKDILLQCHNEGYVNYIHTQSKTLSANAMLCSNKYTEPGVKPETFLVKGIYETAIAAFGTSIQAAKYLSNNSNGFSYALGRPPGHHAGSTWAGGYCYFNNAAGAVFTLIKNGHNRVGLIDIDFHFGNGSSNIFKNMPEVFLGSIHSSTLENYPYKNYAKTDFQIFISFENSSPIQKKYLSSVDSLIQQAVYYGCSALVVSIGYDIIFGDPHGKWTFRPEIFLDIGKILKKVDMPVCLIQEGGYNLRELGKCAYNLISGIIY